MSDEEQALVAALKPWLLEFSKESHALDRLRSIVRELWTDAVRENASARAIDPEADTEIE